MSIDRRRITNGLAWAGAFLVVGVPTADLLSAQLMGGAAASAPAQVAVIEPVAPMPAPVSQRPAAPAKKPETQVAAVPPAKPAPAKPAAAPETADVVDAYLESGRELPSYISGGDASSAPTQVAAVSPERPVITPPASEPASKVDPVEVAAIPTQKVAPVPMPLSMRPEPVSVALVQDPVVIPPGLTPAAPAAVVRPPANVTAADLEDWETGPLADFLAQRQVNAYVDPSFDSDGFFLDEGPNRRQRDRVIAREADPFIFLVD